MEKDNTTRKAAINGAWGYPAGALAGLTLIWLIARLGLVGWLVGLIDPEQIFLKVLSIPLIAGIFIGLGGALTGYIGGWAIERSFGDRREHRLAVGNAFALGVSAGLLVLVFLLLVSLLALYNNLATNRIEQYGLILGLFGLLFGLLSGLMGAFLTVRLRYTWVMILASVLGFMTGGVVFGLLLRLANITESLRAYPVLSILIIITGAAAFFALGGATTGYAYGRLWEKVSRSATSAEARLTALSPARGQTITVAVLGLLVGLIILSTLGQIADFLVINPANLSRVIPSETIGVRWSEPQAYSGQADGGVIRSDDIHAPVSTGDPAQPQHTAWCSASGQIAYRLGDGPIEEIENPSCSGVPGIALGPDGQVHVVWFANELRDTNQVTRSTNAIVESIRLESGWSEPAIAVRTEGPVSLRLSNDETGDLQLAWRAINQEGNTFWSLQSSYRCEDSQLSPLERVGLQVLRSGGYRPAGAAIPYCGNKFEQIMYTPNPEPNYSQVQASQNGAFDQIARIAEDTQYEILFTTMQYEPNDTPPSPGSVLARAVAELYQAVKTNPQEYPRGMTIRILLGNYPEMADFTWGGQIMDAISDIRAAGVDKMIDPEIGWRLEVANYAGTYPHSHTKFIVVDGRTIGSVGFNYGYLHLDKGHPSGRGYDMLDLGLHISGPVAQDGISAFDDMWDGADRIHCEDFHPPGGDWQKTCRELKGVSDHVPEVLRAYIPPDGDSEAFSLYRSMEFKEGDEYIAASLAAANQSIDMIQVNFSLEAICMANLVFPDLCSIDQALPYMHALLSSIEEQGAHVRVIMENTNSNGLENRVGGWTLLQELERRGLSDHLELRFYNGKVHAKSALIDEQLLIIGSQNMHYSSWSDVGLSEHSLATNDPQAIAEYQALFKAKWAEAIPFEEAEYGSSP